MSSLYSYVDPFHGGDYQRSLHFFFVFVPGERARCKSHKITACQACTTRAIELSERELASSLRANKATNLNNRIELMNDTQLKDVIVGAVKASLSQEERVTAVLELAQTLNVGDKVVPIERAETMAQNIAKDLSQRTLKQGDRVQTSQGEAVAVVLTPEELLRRLSA